jgi:hypothetical protein
MAAECHGYTALVRDIAKARKWDGSESHPYLTKGRVWLQPLDSTADYADFTNRRQRKIVRDISTSVDMTKGRLAVRSTDISTSIDMTK